MAKQIARLLKGSPIRPVYVDLEDICVAPLLFAQRYVGFVAFCCLGQEGEDVASYIVRMSC